jgi:S-adenosylmethionine hydrolase
METTQISSNWEMHKQTWVHPDNGILFSDKKEWSTETCYYLDEPKNVMLTESSQSQQVIYFMIPFM